jgi:hypothetical protein
MLQLWNQLQQHPMVMSGLTLAAYHAASAFVGALEMPDSTSGKFYRFFFQFANLFAANYSRSKASTGSAGEQPPKAN